MPFNEQELEYLKSLKARNPSMKKEEALDSLNQFRSNAIQPEQPKIDIPEPDSSVVNVPTNQLQDQELIPETKTFDSDATSVFTATEQGLQKEKMLQEEKARIQSGGEKGLFENVASSLIGRDELAKFAGGETDFANASFQLLNFIPRAAGALTGQGSIQDPSTSVFNVIKKPFNETMDLWANTTANDLITDLKAKKAEVAKRTDLEPKVKQKILSKYNDGIKELNPFKSSKAKIGLATAGKIISELTFGLLEGLGEAKAISKSIGMLGTKAGNKLFKNTFDDVLDDSFSAINRTTKPDAPKPEIKPTQEIKPAVETTKDVTQRTGAGDLKLAPEKISKPRSVRKIDDVAEEINIIEKSRPIEPKDELELASKFGLGKESIRSAKAMNKAGGPEAFIKEGLEFSFKPKGGEKLIFNKSIPARIVDSFSKTKKPITGIIQKLDPFKSTKGGVSEFGEIAKIQNKVKAPSDDLIRNISNRFNLDTKEIGDIALGIPKKLSSGKLLSELKKVDELKNEKDVFKLVSELGTREVNIGKMQQLQRNINRRIVELKGSKDLIASDKAKALADFKIVVDDFIDQSVLKNVGETESTLYKNLKQTANERFGMMEDITAKIFSKSNKNDLGLLDREESRNVLAKILDDEATEYISTGEVPSFTKYLDNLTKGRFQLQEKVKTIGDINASDILSDVGFKERSISKGDYLSRGKKGLRFGGAIRDIQQGKGVRTPEGIAIGASTKFGIGALYDVVKKVVSTHNFRSPEDFPKALAMLGKEDKKALITLRNDLIKLKRNLNVDDFEATVTQLALPSSLRNIIIGDKE